MPTDDLEIESLDENVLAEHNGQLGRLTVVEGEGEGWFILGRTCSAMAAVTAAQKS
ncbi:hypothetical protein HO173_008279 [Letharia columbiana]|uniref:Uncharacterized protein n=1 Tax=Letharia columbiana TaxID=112416 RepID=A0A8H6L2V8_9LECA|nr:uncharacterized protein HO173_008279 [Letharia columbiana]KAF6233506.1 hypothetical protein HO173_008279 [Letharia columbiana]